RSAVAEQYAGIDPDRVLIAAPQECIFLFLMSLLSPGDHVLVMSPAYQSLLSVPRAAGCQVTPIPVTEDGEGWVFDMDLLGREIKKNTACIIVNTPHNPTGLVLDVETRKILAETAAKHGIPVFCDEMYRGLEYGFESTPPSFCEEYPEAVCLSGLSKASGLPGLRIGYLVSHNRRYIEAAAALKDYTTICNAAPAEFLAEIAVRKREEILRRTLALVRNNLTAVEALFRRYPRVLTLKKGTGGSTILPRFRPGLSSETVAKDLVKEEDTLLVPGTLFGMAPEYFRIGLGRRDLPETLKRFDRYLERHYGTP
ncbi:MAG: pyridoxal phosphate-dependent aminotransferase, partial [Spirochaetales bacterium]|nr:pyridoxal phosphate-dependent aminotransferase [Spirochaetales bacterium]